MTLRVVSYVLALVSGYFLMAVLAVTPGTRTLRAVLWSIIAGLVWHAAATVDLSPNRESYNSLLVFFVVFIVTRTLDWSLTGRPFERHSRPEKGSQSTIMSNALDLALTLRGFGWDWSHGVPTPCETRPTSRGRFIFHVALSAAAHAFIYVILHGVIFSIFPTEVRGLSGGSIFDQSLPFPTRYLRATVISTLTAFWVYASIQTFYDTCTIVGVLVFGQDPARWPPAFDAPWRATSLRSFWGRRWHQFFRRMFLVQGGFPLSHLLGRTGLVVGAFISSAVTHYATLVPFNKELEPWRMMFALGIMAPAVLAEGIFKQSTGRKVGGWAGWVWTMAWLVVSGNLVTDTYARSGAFGHSNFMQGTVLGNAIVERLVARFDSWLHTM